jgi:hypothetical protein
MARYFFDIITDGKLIPDEEGMNLPDIAAVRWEAQRSLADLALDVIRSEHSPKLTMSCAVLKVLCSKQPCIGLWKPRTKAVY